MEEDLAEARAVPPRSPGLTAARPASPHGPAPPVTGFHVRPSPRAIGEARPRAAARESPSAQEARPLPPSTCGFPSHFSRGQVPAQPHVEEASARWKVSRVASHALLRVACPGAATRETQEAFPMWPLLSHSGVARPRTATCRNAFTREARPAHIKRRAPSSFHVWPSHPQSGRKVPRAATRGRALRTSLVLSRAAFRHAGQHAAARERPLCA